MNEGKMNLALFRVCAIIFIVNELNKLVGNLWLYLMQDVDDGSFSWVYVPISLVFIALGVFALVKKNNLILKIFAVMIFVSMVVGTVHLVRYSHLYSALGTGYIVAKGVGYFINHNLVIMVTVFFLKSGKIDLLRFCAAYFLFYGLCSATDAIAVKSFSVLEIFGCVLPVSVGAYVLVKKNVSVLMLYAVVAVALTLWNTFQYVEMRFFDTIVIGEGFIGILFNSFFVVCAATFFIEPELTRKYFQNAKNAILAWKNRT